jgi:hypothetical protein
MVYGSAALCLIALLGARAIRARATTQPTNAPQPAASRPNEAVLSVEAAVERDGFWYVVDARGHRIHVVDSTGTPLHSFGRRGSGPGEFNTPMTVARSATHTFVAEMGRADISVFDASGQFVRHLRVRGPCAQGNIAAMGIGGSTLYVLRRCVELPARIRLQVERSSDARILAVWHAVADTTPVTSRAGLPIHVPVMAVSDTRLIIGDGTNACLKAVRLPDGASQGTRCFSEVPRRPLPAEEKQKLNAKWRGRIAVPDSLPRLMAVVLRDSIVAAQIPETAETTSWIELSWRSNPNQYIHALGRGPAQKSFLGARSQLIATEDVSGMRLQVVPIAR